MFYYQYICINKKTVMNTYKIVIPKSQTRTVTLKRIDTDNIHQGVVKAKRWIKRYSGELNKADFVLVEERKVVNPYKFKMKRKTGS